MKPSIFILGAGGHGKVVYEAIISQNKYNVIGFVDNKLDVGTSVIEDCCVVSSQTNVLDLKNKVSYFIVAIGNNQARAELYNMLFLHFKPALIFHPKAIISPTAHIGEGSVVLANAIISAVCKVGKNSIINVATVLDHESNVGNHVYLKMATLVGNNAVIGDFYTSQIGEIVNSNSSV